MTDLRGIKRRIEQMKFRNSRQAKREFKKEGMLNKGSKRAIAEFFGHKETRKGSNVFRDERGKFF